MALFEVPLRVREFNCVSTLYLVPKCPDHVHPEETLTDTERRRRRLKADLRLVDLSAKDMVKLERKAKVYLWYVITVSIFYFLPVIQLVITYQRVVNSGDQNVCYYNFLCAHPVGSLSDFNHVFSNAGYGVLGFLFMCITFHRQKVHEAAVAENQDIDKCLGIPPHFGLLYTMGVALIVEGFFSASYHVCPNDSNFQFDTSFMYVICAMCMIKIYHSRHPDISANAWATFATLAVAIILGMSGVLAGNTVFWSIFTVIHILTCIHLSLQLYFVGNWKHHRYNPLNLMSKWLSMCQNEADETDNVLGEEENFLRRADLTLILVGNVINWALAGFGFYYLYGDFATHLLAIFMVNLILYVTFYSVMKIFSHERILFVPLIFIVLSLLTWGPSLYFFIDNVTSWKLTPAQSQEYNQPCILLGFYDNHDIWHFLSSFAMFFSFMVLLTLDDDRLNVDRKDIKVF